jgi:hypothetical protein
MAIAMSALCNNKTEMPIYENIYCFNSAIYQTIIFKLKI